MEQRNIAKAELLYRLCRQLAAVREQQWHVNWRSRMNIPFLLRDDSRNEAFLAGAKARGLLQLKGHKSVGGMRASLYNAMPLEGVQALIAYMREFEHNSA